MLIYAYSKCSTCKDALHFLNEKGIKVEIKEITTTPPTLKELNTMLGYLGGNIKKLFNTSGMLYREMQLTEKLKEMPLNESLGLLTAHGMLVKRPFLLGSDFGITGFNKAKWLEILG